MPDQERTAEVVRSVHRVSFDCPTCGGRVEYVESVNDPPRRITRDKAVFVTETRVVGWSCQPCGHGLDTIMYENRHWVAGEPTEQSADQRPS
jgi:predicted RNA-binding Zn-ribbon protein involved in translation (DUF1610 family)